MYKTKQINEDMKEAPTAGNKCREYAIEGVPVLTRTYIQFQADYSTTRARRSLCSRLVNSN